MEKLKETKISKLQWPTVPTNTTKKVTLSKQGKNTKFDKKNQNVSSAQQQENACNKKPSTIKKKLEVRQTKTSQFRILKANPLLISNMKVDPKTLPPSVTMDVPKDESLKACFSLSFKSPMDSSLSNTRSKLQKSIINDRNRTINKNGNSNHKSVTVLLSTSSRTIMTASKKTQGLTKSGVEPKLNTIKKKSSLNDKKQETVTSMSKDRKLNVKIDLDKNQNNLRNSLSSQHFQRKKGKTVDRIQSKCHLRGLHSTQIGNKMLTTVSTDREIKLPFKIRRSLSDQNFNRQRGEATNHPQGVSNLSQLVSTKSLEDINHKDEAAKVFILDMPSIEEVSEISSVAPDFAVSERVMSYTPNVNRKSMYMRLSTPKYTPGDLHNRLEAWLKKKAKSLQSFGHLKCFGIHPIVFHEENKENIEANITESDSFEELGISDKTEAQDNNETIVYLTNDNLENVAKEALKDLYKLITEGYPQEQCESWLGLICEKYSCIYEEPMYWECRAEFEQNRGNIANAVEYLKNAIVHGSEISKIDDSLENLLEKFSLLNINSKEEDKHKYEKQDKIIKDARNIFKSTIIQFAVQERDLKRKGSGSSKKYLVTPVRRSARLSKVAICSSSPGIKLIDSLREFEIDHKEMEFASNSYLR